MGSDALQRLEDKLDIRELVARYNYAIDEERPEEWVATFVPEGTFESTALGAHSGADALLDSPRDTSLRSTGVMSRATSLSPSRATQPRRGAT